MCVCAYDFPCYGFSPGWCLASECAFLSVPVCTFFYSLFCVVFFSVHVCDDYTQLLLKHRHGSNQNPPLRSHGCSINTMNGQRRAFNIFCFLFFASCKKCVLAVENWHNNGLTERIYARFWIPWCSAVCKEKVRGDTQFPTDDVKSLFEIAQSHEKILKPTDCCVSQKFDIFTRGKLGWEEKDNSNSESQQMNAAHIERSCCCSRCRRTGDHFFHLVLLLLVNKTHYYVFLYSSPYCVTSVTHVHGSDWLSLRLNEMYDEHLVWPFWMYVICNIQNR